IVTHSPDMIQHLALTKPHNKQKDIVCPEIISRHADYTLRCVCHESRDEHKGHRLENGELETTGNNLNEAYTLPVYQIAIKQNGHD
ncbi:MAG: hypothetical protein MR912_02575, partial [Prevotella sp.]|nr:hypothetical protein [Prevotella sp.]